MAVMIGVDPHKGSHTAVVLDESEEPLGELRVRSAANQVERLLGWAAPFGERTWAIEGAGGLVPTASDAAVATQVTGTDRSRTHQ